MNSSLKREIERVKPEMGLVFVCECLCDIAHLIGSFRLVFVWRPFETSAGSAECHLATAALISNALWCPPRLLPVSPEVAPGRRKNQQTVGQGALMHAIRALGDSS